MEFDFEIEQEPYRLFLKRHKQETHCYLVLFGHRQHHDPLGQTHTGHSIKVYSVVMQLMRHVAQHPPLGHQILAFYWTALGSTRQRLYHQLMLKVARDLGWHHSCDPQHFPASVGINEDCYLVYHSSKFEFLNSNNTQ